MSRPPVTDPAPEPTAGSAPARRRRAQRGSGELLRDEIIAAAKELLSARGDVDAVSIRAVADAVGVSPPSIYLHFADKDDLVVAVVSDVFNALDARMLEAAAATGPSPMERVRAYGLAYVRFARDFPEHYRLATSGIGADQPGAIDQILANSAFAHLREAVADCIEVGLLTGPDPLPIALDLWAAAHGAASLMIAKPFLPWGDPERAADRMLGATMVGHAVGRINTEPLGVERAGELIQLMAARPPDTAVPHGRFTP